MYMYLIRVVETYMERTQMHNLLNWNHIKNKRERENIILIGGILQNW